MWQIVWDIGMSQKQAIGNANLYPFQQYSVQYFARNFWEDMISFNIDRLLVKWNRDWELIRLLYCINFASTPIALPRFSRLTKVIWKDVGVCTCLSQSLALALPPHRISNARSPRQEILYAYAYKGADTIHPTQTFRCLIFCELNLRDSRLEDNVRKRPFWAKDLRICISCCLEDSIPSMSDLPAQINDPTSHGQN